MNNWSSTMIYLNWTWSEVKYESLLVKKTDQHLEWQVLRGPLPLGRREVTVIPDLLDTCIYAYNTSVHESTSFTPFEVMFGRKAVLPIDVEMDIASPYINDEAEPLGSVIERLSEQRLKTLTMVKECIHRAQKKQRDAYDRKHALSNSYVIGDLVLKNFKGF